MANVRNSEIENRAISMPHMQKVIGYRSLDTRGRALQRELIARERDSGAEWLVRMGGSARVHVRVTVAALREHAPDLVATKGKELRAALRSAIAAERSGG